MNEIERLKEKNELYLELLMEERARHKWIPIGEKLPNENGMYIVYKEHTWGGGYKAIACDRYDNGKFECGNMRKVVAWQPLPELYKNTEVEE